jgi:hypothetical protein
MCRENEATTSVVVVSVVFSRKSAFFCPSLAQDNARDVRARGAFRVLGRPAGVPRGTRAASMRAPHPRER